MIEVNEALKIIKDSVQTWPEVEVPLHKSLGRTLREEIVADNDFPPFHRVMMDGIAIKHSALEKGIKTFHIAGTQGAGDPQMRLINPQHCLEVMTGAVAPEGADLVVPYEDILLDAQKKTATLQVEALKKGKNIHERGSDKKIGDVLVKPGSRIGAPEIAVAASVGMSKLKVTKNPTVAVVSTGNELVSVDEQPLPHQIRRSNVHAVAAALHMQGIKSTLFHFADDKTTLREELKKILKNHDLMVLSGGVSRGKFDFVPEALESLGIKKLFHRIRQKPGKPFWFGKRDDGKVVFAFPGNPVSTFLCYHKYMVPWLRASLGQPDPAPLTAVLSEDVSIKSGLTYFMQVTTQVDKHGCLMATPVMGRGSGDHANLIDANCFLELPPETYNFKQGMAYNLIPFRIF